MSALLKFAHTMDWVSDRFGKLASWAVLLAAMISAGNAFIRYGIDWSSNGLLEIQWYLFAWMVMVGAPYVLKANEHVRVDLVYGKLKGNGAVYVDIFGLVVFLMPVMGFLAWISFPYFWNTFVTGEVSSNAGGLIRWPAMLLLPLGFFMVFLQGLSETIKRVAWLRGEFEMNLVYERPLQ